MKRCNKWDIIHAAIKPFANTLEFMRIILVTNGVDDKELTSLGNDFLWRHFIHDFFNAMDEIVLEEEDDETKETDNDKVKEAKHDGERKKES